MRYAIITILLVMLATNAIGGLPPTTSKVSGDSNNVTTFNYQFPNMSGTHTGTTVSITSYALPSPSPSSVLMDISGAWTVVPFPSPSPSGQVITTTNTGFQAQAFYPEPSPSPSAILMDISGAWTVVPFPSPSPSGQIVSTTNTGFSKIAPGSAGNVLESDGNGWVPTPGYSGVAVAAIVTNKPQTSYTANTAIIWPSVTADTNSAYNNSTGEFTAPNTGYYSVCASIVGTATSGDIYAAVAGSRQTPPMSNLTSTGRANGCTVVAASATQKITVMLSANSTMQTPDNEQGVTFTQVH